MLAPSLRLRGFKKSRATWRKEDDEAIAVLNVQGSQRGPSFYINLGVYFHLLGDRHQPTESHCHARTRLDVLVPDPHRLHALLDFEKSIQSEIRAADLEALVVARALPWLEAVSTIRGLLEYCGARSPRSLYLSKEARELLLAQDGP
ncbi:MAG: DUF4304 domain-containing protein [Planctomycetes bacterium]|nr:DUF4304 domain-containing protein [Planctomycetota bacterium]